VKGVDCCLEVGGWRDRKLDMGGSLLAKRSSWVMRTIRPVSTELSRAKCIEGLYELENYGDGVSIVLVLGCE